MAEEMPTEDDINLLDALAVRYHAMKRNNVDDDTIKETMESEIDSHLLVHSLIFGLDATYDLLESWLEQTFEDQSMSMLIRLNDAFQVILDSKSELERL